MRRATSMRHFTHSREVCLVVGVLSSAALGCTGVVSPNFGAADAVASGGPGGTGGAGSTSLGSYAGMGGGSEDAGISVGDGAITTGGVGGGSGGAGASPRPAAASMRRQMPPPGQAERSARAGLAARLQLTPPGPQVARAPSMRPCLSVVPAAVGNRRSMRSSIAARAAQSP
jgi:hypothetical protein